MANVQHISFIKLKTAQYVNCYKSLRATISSSVKWGCVTGSSLHKKVVEGLKLSLLFASPVFIPGHCAAFPLGFLPPYVFCKHHAWP